jgi:metallophosphoesterase superfamily enzyme
VNELFVLGDLFHSGVNYDVRLFDAWRDVHHSIDINLVKGNHDIMSDEIYSHFEIRLHKKYFLWNRFLFTHKPMDEAVQLNGCDYVFCGHVHPGVRLVGKAKQSLSLPCFHFNEKQCTLPAFGEFTGKHIIKPNIKDKVFVISKSGNEFVVLKLDT